MKKFVLTGLMFLFALISFAQSEEENGKIFIRHPYIEVVNKSMKSYADNDFASLAMVFADTAKIWISGIEKPISAKDMLKDWATDRDFYDSIKVSVVGYPDYLHYKDKDQKWVQSWWTWSGKSKKTGELVKVEFVQFDKFNSAGKIELEGLYGDFSKIVKN
ncbi:MAG: hypothetical protein JNK79_05715 [Chitinophagaceae bacterium]|nr:hypothetical protein [Chitinophagaceae bacterium]